MMYGVLGIITAFAVLGILISKKVEFGLALISATIILLLFTNFSFEALEWVYEILIEYDTINLVAIILLIGLIGFIYRDSGQINRIIKELQSAFPDRRMVIASIPAIFGLMPMPGGALVSAPMIDKEGDRLGMDGVHKAYVNWWFRHIWFTIYPLGLGLIIAATITGVNLYMIALFNVPIFVTHLIIGINFGLRDIKVDKVKSDGPANLILLIYDFLPIIIALSLNIILPVPLALTLLLAVLMLIYQNRKKYGLSETANMLKNGLSKNLLLAGIGIMLFKGTIERSGALIPVIDLLEGRIPLIAVVILGSFAMGFSIGHLPAGVGITFPVLIPLLPIVNTQTVAMVFIFILIGYIISPIHLCIILTLEYYKANMNGFYKKAAPSMMVLVGSIFLWLFLTGTLSLF